MEVEAPYQPCGKSDGKYADAFGSFEDVITRTVRKRLEKSYPNIETEKILDARRNEKEAEKTKFAEGCGFYKLVWLFLIGALLGDLVETVFCRFTLGWWMSRSSVVYGPFSVVVGDGWSLFDCFSFINIKIKSDRYIFFLRNSSRRCV